MDVIIQSLGFDAAERLKNFTTEKVQTLKSDQIIRANVKFSLTQDKTEDNKCCEIILEIPGNDMYIKRTTAHFESSVNECIEVLHLNLKKEKEKNLDRRQADATTIQDKLSEL